MDGTTEEDCNVARYRRGDAQGSVISPGCLLQDQLVQRLQRQIRDRLPEPRVLGLQLLKSLHLVRLQTAVLVAPTIPIASGEREFTRFDFQDLLERRALDIAQPDVARAGGMTEIRACASCRTG